MIKLVEEKKEQRKQLNNRLKPCPFCGGKAQIEERSKPDGKRVEKILWLIAGTIVIFR